MALSKIYIVLLHWTSGAATGNPLAKSSPPGLTEDRRLWLASPGCSPALAYDLRIRTIQREGWADTIEKAGQGKQRLTFKHGSFEKQISIDYIYKIIIAIIVR